MPLSKGMVIWEIFKKAFLYWFFPREKREAKVDEFINLHHGSMSVLDYSLKLTKLSRFGPSLVSDPTDEISDFRLHERRIVFSCAT